MADPTQAPAWHPPLCLTVRREWDVPHAVAQVQQACLRAGASAQVAASVATAASELANNLWMHTTHGGEIRLERETVRGRERLLLTAHDDGPGIPDIALAMQEGYSTAGGMGCGLPGVQRLMDEFALDSAVGRGTEVRCAKWLPLPAAAPGLARVRR